MTLPAFRSARRGFTFVEALMTIAILGIMAAILIGAFSSTSADASKAISRQQQAAIQNALNAWVNSDSNRVTVINATAGTAKPKTVEEIRVDYNSRTTTLARLNLIAAYLDDATKAHLFEYTTNSGKIKSEALTASRQFISLPDWTTTVGYPTAVLTPDSN